MPPASAQPRPGGRCRLTGRRRWPGSHRLAGTGYGPQARLLVADGDAARVKLEQDREEFLATSPDDLAEGMKSLLSPADAAVLAGDMADYLAYSLREGLAPGGQGWWDDGHAEASPWGFELARISVPVLLVHGRQDRFVPFGHGQWLATHIPGVEARLLDGDGHLTLIEHRIGEVHAWLADRL